jgi:NTE family protein
MLEGHRDRILLRTTPAGLILTGGGARAAYQVGVLKGIAAVLRDTRRGLDPDIAQGHNPFQILVGTSAGAINAAALACRADNFQESVAMLVQVWESFRADHVYRSDVLGVVRTGARWLMLLSLGWMVRRSLRLRPRSLLDNAPLAALLERMIDTDRLRRSLERGHLRALAVTASSYTSGRHVTFYQSLNNYEIAPRLQRVYVHARIGLQHLLASSAIPFVFPSVPLTIGAQPEHYGDGSMRQISPISPAIYLGAERVLVIGAGQLGSPGVLNDVDPQSDPSLAQIAGHAMASIFLDALASDIERLEKLNVIANALTPVQRRALNLRPIESLVIAPSERLDGIAAHFVGTLPRPVRGLLDVLEAGTSSGASLASYLLFESAFTRVLIDLGYSDTLKRRDEVLRFLTERRESAPAQPPRVVVA